MNKTNGNLRGVKGFVEVDIDKYEPVSPQGWVIWGKKGIHKFNIYFKYTDKLGIELIFSREALIRMIQAIGDKEDTSTTLGPDNHSTWTGPDYDYLEG